MPTFIKVSGHLKLERDVFFTIPRKLKFFREKPPVSPTHVGVKNGNLSFFYCMGDGHLPESYRSSNNWHYYLIPPGAIKVKFPYAFLEGFDLSYGSPEWIF